MKINNKLFTSKSLKMAERSEKREAKVLIKISFDVPLNLSLNFTPRFALLEKG